MLTRVLPAPTSTDAAPAPAPTLAAPVPTPPDAVVAAPPLLVALLSDPSLVKAGVGIGQDVSRLAADYGILMQVCIRGMHMQGFMGFESRV